MRSKYRPIRNLVIRDGEAMTEIDHKLRMAIQAARMLGLPLANIVPRRESCGIVGYYIINESGETSVLTI